MNGLENISIPQITVNPGEILQKAGMDPETTQQLTSSVQQLISSEDDSGSIKSAIVNSAARQLSQNGGTISINEIGSDVEKILPKTQDGSIDYKTLGQQSWENVKQRATELYETGKETVTTVKQYISGEKELVETKIEDADRVTFKQAYDKAWGILQGGSANISSTESMETMTDALTTVTTFIDQKKTDVKNSVIRTVNGVRSGFAKR